jgi:hypothetical protein
MKRLPSRAIDAIAARREDRVITACGCVVLPEVICLFPGENEAECREHGWQTIVRRATVRECANMVLGLPLDYTPSYPDVPPF